MSVPYTETVICHNYGRVPWRGKVLVPPSPPPTPSDDEIAQRHGPLYEEFGGDLAVRFADFTDTLIAVMAMNLKNQMLAMDACNCYLNKMLQTRNFCRMSFLHHYYTLETRNRI